MRRSVRWTLFATAMVALALFVAACGGDDNNDSGGGGGAAKKSGGTEIKAGKAGGTLTYLAAGDVDYVDPGQDYYTFGYMVQYAVNRTLYSFKPDNSVKPVPDLAEGEP